MPCKLKIVDGEQWVRHLPDGKWHKLPNDAEAIAIIERSLKRSMDFARQLGIHRDRALGLSQELVTLGADVASFRDPESNGKGEEQ